MRAVNIDALKSDIVRPGIDEKLIPLLAFRGRVDLGYAHRMFNFAIAMMHAEADNLGQGVKLSHNPEFAHVLEPERPRQHSSLKSFFTRLRLCPNVTDNIPHLTEYCEFILPRYWHLERVSIDSKRPNCAWWRQYKPKGKIGKYRHNPADLVYPFALYEPNQDNELLHLVNNTVPRHLPPEMRADVCQDLIVGVLSGDILEGDIRDNVQEAIRQARKLYPSKWRGVSLDQPLSGSDDRTMLDVLSYEDIHWS